MMTKILKKINFDILICIYVILLLAYIFINNILIFYRNGSILNLSTGLIYFCFVGLGIYAIRKWYYKLKFDMYDTLVIILIIIGIISTSSAINTEVALYGFVNRNEGFFQILGYYTLLLNCKSIMNEKIKKIITYTIIGVGVIQSVYGILQFFDIKSVFNIDVIRYKYYSLGLEVNSNFFGTVTIVGLSLALTSYFFSNKKSLTIISFVCSAILFLGMLCSGAMSAMVAVIVLIISLFVLFFILKMNFKKIFIKLLVPILLFGVSYCFFSTYDDGYYLEQSKKSINEIFDSLTGNYKPQYGSGRLYIWEKTLEIVPENLWTGVGIDNYYYAFGKEPLIDKKSGLAVDKAHNEYLHKLITEGIFSLITYCILLGTVTFKSIKKIFKEKNKESFLYYALLLCFIAYCVQAFFNISVISVAPMFYIVMGLLISEIEMKDEKI